MQGYRLKGKCQLSKNSVIVTKKVYNYVITMLVSEFRSIKQNSVVVICIVSGAKTWWKQFLKQSNLKRCRRTYVVYFKWETLNGNLRGSRELVIPYVNTTTYSLHSFRYTSANMWNKLTEDLRSLTSLNEFRAKICQISFKHQCNCYLCR